MTVRSADGSVRGSRVSAPSQKVLLDIPSIPLPIYLGEQIFTSVRGRLCAFQGARTLLHFLLGRGVHVMTGVIYASMYPGEE